MVRNYRQRIEGLLLRVEHELRGRVRETQQTLDDFGLKMIHAVRMRRQNALQDVKRLDMQLKALNPLAVLNRGYSITMDAAGGIVRTVADLKDGQVVTTRLAKGRFESEVKSRTGIEDLKSDGGGA